MQNNELKAGTEAEQRTAADSIPSAQVLPMQCYAHFQEEERKRKNREAVARYK